MPPQRFCVWPMWFLTQLRQLLKASTIQSSVLHVVNLLVDTNGEVSINDEEPSVEEVVDVCSQ